MTGEQQSSPPMQPLRIPTVTSLGYLGRPAGSRVRRQVTFAEAPATASSTEVPVEGRVSETEQRELSDDEVLSILESVGELDRFVPNSPVYTTPPYHRRRPLELRLNVDPELLPYLGKIGIPQINATPMYWSAPEIESSLSQQQQPWGSDASFLSHDSPVQVGPLIREGSGVESLGSVQAYVDSAGEADAQDERALGVETLGLWARDQSRTTDSRERADMSRKPGKRPNIKSTKFVLGTAAVLTTLGITNSLVYQFTYNTLTISKQDVGFWELTNQAIDVITGSPN